MMQKGLVDSDVRINVLEILKPVCKGNNIIRSHGDIKEIFVLITFLFYENIIFSSNSEFQKFKIGRSERTKIARECAC